MSIWTKSVDEDEIVGCQDEGRLQLRCDRYRCRCLQLLLDPLGLSIAMVSVSMMPMATGVCDEFEVEGCTDEVACNYAEAATEEDGSCTYPTEFYLDCDGACLNDEDGDGLCDEVEALIPPDYNPDWNGDYCYTVADLTHLLCLFGTCGLDTTGGPDYNPFLGEDSCYSAFDLIPFLTLFQTCLEVEEAGSPVGATNAPRRRRRMNDGMNDEASPTTTTSNGLTCPKGAHPAARPLTRTNKPEPAPTRRAPLLEADGELEVEAPGGQVVRDGVAPARDVLDPRVVDGVADAEQVEDLERDEAFEGLGAVRAVSSSCGPARRGRGRGRSRCPPGGRRAGAGCPCSAQSQGGPKGSPVP